MVACVAVAKRCPTSGISNVGLMSWLHIGQPSHIIFVHLFLPIFKKKGLCVHCSQMEGTFLD